MCIRLYLAGHIISHTDEKKFQRWRGSSLNEFTEKPVNSLWGTPLGVQGEDFQEFLREVDGFEPGSDAYIYVVGLERQDDATLWYYIGETTSGVEGLKSRFEIHLDCGMSKPVQRDGVEVIDGKLSENETHSYALIGVERIEPVSVDDENLKEARIAEKERKTAYEIAIEKQTTKVIGGS